MAAEHHRGAEVAADQHERDDGEQAGHHRHEQVVQLAQAPLLVGVDVGGPQHDRELGDLGGLDVDRTERQPVLVAVDQHAEAGDEPEQHEGDEEPGVGEPADVAASGVRDATQAAGTPSTTHISWRFTTA